MTPLDRAIEHMGGATKLASLLQVSVQRLMNWTTRGVPAERCPDIERATEGKVRCEELRPDVAWDVLRGQPVGPVLPSGAEMWTGHFDHCVAIHHPHDVPHDGSTVPGDLGA